MDVERIIIIHPNRMLGECMAEAINGRVTSSDSEISCVCTSDCQIQAHTHLDPGIGTNIPTVFIFDSEISSNPVSEITIAELRNSANNRFIQLLGNKTSYSESDKELKCGFICFISEHDGISDIECAIVKASQNNLFVSPSRLHNASTRLSVKLTRREHECCTYILYNIDDVSDILNINKNTIRTYYERVKNKLDIDNNQLLVAWAVINGIAYVPWERKSQILGKSA